jgi:RNA polymerase sigma factor (TIGR02999 family)
MTPDPNITQLLAHVQNGDLEAERQLMEAVYEELHRLAAGYMRRERPDHTLQASALVNEAYVRLIGNGPVSWESRAHFFVTAAQTMRRVLIDHARRHVAEKRGGAGVRIDLNENIAAVENTESGRMLDLDRALTRLASLDALFCGADGGADGGGDGDFREDGEAGLGGGAGVAGG